MDSPSNSPVNLKHRLTGAIILLLVPVLLLPWFLDTSSVPQRPQGPDTALQPKAEFVAAIDSSRPTLAVPKPESADERIGSDESDQTPPAPAAAEGSAQPGSSENRAVEPDTPIWIVQVGAFKQVENLEQRQARLADNGIASSRERATVNDQPIWRLVLGPFETKEIAERESGKATLVTGERAVVVQKSP